MIVRDQIVTDYKILFYLAFIKLASDTIQIVLFETFPVLSFIRGILNKINTSFMREGSS